MEVKWSCGTGLDSEYLSFLAFFQAEKLSRAHFVLLSVLASTTPYSKFVTISESSEMFVLVFGMKGGGVAETAWLSLGMGRVGSECVFIIASSGRLVQLHIPRQNLLKVLLQST